MAFLFAGGIPAGVELAAQEVEEIDESGIALLRGAPGASARRGFGRIEGLCEDRVSAWVNNRD